MRPALPCDRLCRDGLRCWAPGTENPMDGHASVETRSDDQHPGDTAENTITAAEAMSALRRERS